MSSYEKEGKAPEPPQEEGSLSKRPDVKGHSSPRLASSGTNSSSPASSSSHLWAQPRPIHRPRDYSSSPSEAISSSSFSHSNSYSPSLNTVAEPYQHHAHSEQYERAALQDRQYHLRRLERPRQRPSSAASLRTTSSTILAKLKRPLSRSAAYPQTSPSHNTQPRPSGLARQLSSSDPPLSSSPMTTMTTPGAFRAHAHHHGGVSTRLPLSRSSNPPDSTALRGQISVLEVEEHKEAAQDVYIWMPDNISKTAGSQGSLRSPPGSNISPDPGASGSGKRHGLTPHWLKDRSIKQGAHSSRLWGPPPLPAGAWKKGTVSLKENAQFYVYGEKNTLLHPILASRLKVTDIRPVDPTLLQRYNVLGLFSRPLAIAGGSGRVSSRGRAATPSDQTIQSSGNDDVVYIAFPTDFKLQYWMSLLRAYAIPEIYGQPQTWRQGGSYRWQREVHLHCHDFRAATSPPTGSMGSSTTSSSASEGDEQAGGRDDALWTPPKPAPCNDLGRGDATPATVTREFRRRASSSAAAVNDIDKRRAPESAVEAHKIYVSSSQHDDANYRRMRTSSWLAREEDDASISSISHFAQNITSSQATPPRSGTIERANFLQPSAPRSMLLASLKGRKDQLQQRPLPHSTNPATKERAATSSAKATSLPSLACLVYFDGVLAARTTGQSWTADKPHYHWLEKFDLKDLPILSSLRVDVYQDHLPASGGIWPPARGADQQGPFAPPSRSRMKFVGSTSLPLDTMTRGEQIEGWFPIWSGNGSGEQVQGDPSTNFLDDECVGELYLVATICEEVVMKREEYMPLQRLLDSSQDFGDLVVSLEARVPNMELASHLFDIYRASSTLVTRVVQLSHDYDFQTHDSKLLLRGGAVLTRLVSCILDRYGQDWLRCCLSRTLKRVCEEGECVDIKALDLFSTTFGTQNPSTSGGSSHHLFVFVNQVGPHAPMGLEEGRAQDGKMVIEAKAAMKRLRELLGTLWSDIYDSRHQCPVELRGIFAAVRRTVYEQSLVTSSPSEATAAGLQAIGSLVFLRFFCPAIVAPAMSGLMLTSPDQDARNTLQTLSTLILRLHNKTGDPNRINARGWVRELDDFWKEQANVYDDFVTALCTGPDVLQARDQQTQGDLEQYGPPSMLHLDEEDRMVHTLIARRMGQLPIALHRELFAAEIPAFRMGDQAAPFARFANFIVRNINPYNLDANRGTLWLDSGSDLRNAAPQKAGSERADCQPESAETVTATSLKVAAPRIPPNSKVVAEQAGDCSSHEKLCKLVDECRRIVETARDLVKREGIAPKPVPLAALCAQGTTANLTERTAKRADEKRVAPQSSARRGVNPAAAPPTESATRSPQRQPQSSTMDVTVDASQIQSQVTLGILPSAWPLTQHPRLERASNSSGADTQPQSRGTKESSADL